MIYLALAVLCSVAVSVLLKLLRQRSIDIRQTIAMGYPVATVLTWLLLTPDLSAISTLGGSWWVILALGLLLPLVFVMLGRALETVGIIATDAAQRLSLLIPIIAAFVLFAEVLTAQRIVGIAIGFLALGALMYRRSESTGVNAHDKALIIKDATSPLTPPSAVIPSYVWLLGVWLGYGVIDILFKQVARQGAAFPLTLFLSFGLAGALLAIYLVMTHTRWQARALLAGLLLGALNMGNIYAYVRAHQLLAESPSVVFTGMNVGVISVATVMGVVLFKEQLSRVNILGLGLAILCVVVLFLA